MRIFLTLLSLLVALVALPGPPAMAEDVLDGTFLGVKEADGARIRISPDADGFSGVFFDAVGRRQSFEADRVGVLAEAVLDMGGETVLMRLEAKPYGADVALIPFDAGGNLVFQQSRFLTFLREGLELPKPPPDYTDPPLDPNARIAANSFLASYAFWSADGVLAGYLALPPRFQTLMALFPAIQLDVVFKLCQAQNADQALAKALKGQGVSCTEVTAGMAEAQRTGSFAKFKGEVASERQTLRTTVRCADGYVVTKRECDRASAAVGRQAVSLETAATVLRRYR